MTFGNNNKNNNNKIIIMMIMKLEYTDKVIAECCGNIVGMFYKWQQWYLFMFVGKTQISTK